jgi:phage repressor protein C with HTH and peptisase S24 domain
MQNDRNSLLSTAQSALQWPEHMKVFRVTSDNMEPFIQQNDFVVVDTLQTELREAVFAFQNDNTICIRRIQPLLSGKIRVLVDNPKYPANEVERSIFDAQNIIGRVVMAERHL